MHSKKYHCPKCGSMLNAIIPAKEDFPKGKHCFDTMVQCPKCKAMFMRFAYSSGVIKTIIPVATVNKEGLFTCICGASHSRGPIDACNTYRCLACGEISIIKFEEVPA